MPFGLKNAPATFQSYMEKVLKDVLHIFVEVYIDDIIIYSENEEDHAHHVQIVFALLEQANLRMKIEKCNFGVKRIEFLGFDLQPDGIRPLKERIANIVDAKVAKTRTGILKFLGLVRYYQRFIPHLAEISHPLTKMLRKEASMHDWSHEQDEAIEVIKDMFRTTQVMAHFDPSRPTILITDASHYAMGAVLSQIVDEEGTERPICFSSKTFDRHQENYTVTEKECLAVVWATEIHQTLLKGITFTIETDHEALKYLISIKEPVGRLARWAMKLQEFDMKVKYRKGEENGAADYVSRLYEKPDGSYEVRHILQTPQFFKELQNEEIECAQVTTRSQARKQTKSKPVAEIPPNRQRAQIEPAKNHTSKLDYEFIKCAQQQDELVQQIANFKQTFELPNDKKVADFLKTYEQDFIQEEGLWYIFETLNVPKSQMHKKVCRLVVPQAIKDMVIKQAHDHPIIGHKGRLPTLHLLKSAYYWDNMHKDVTEYIQNCDTCQKKDKRQNPVEIGRAHV